MKRYMVFAGDDYYPSGGMRDFVGDFVSEEDAVSVAKLEHGKGGWSHVYDTERRRFAWKSWEFGE